VATAIAAAFLPAVRARAQANPATLAIPRPEFPWWLERHQQKLQELAQAKPKLIFIGDSIVNGFELGSPYPQYDFLSLWQRYYGDRNAVNLGFNGDSTSNVLWRLANGEMAGIKPAVAVLLIGTNNTMQGQTAEQTQAGIDAVIAMLRQGLPATKVLVVGILPSGVSPLKSAADGAVNAYLAEKYATARDVTFVDASFGFLKDGQVDTGLFMDPRNTPPGPAIHPDAFAQARLAEAIEPTLARLLGDQPKPATLTVP
jgi:lysophospholipase L1-like esterase